MRHTRVVATRQDLLRCVPPAGRAAELGTFAGTFAREILAICQPSELHLIDRWAGDIVCGDQDGQQIITQHGDDLYRKLRRKFHGHPIVTLHRADTSHLLSFGPNYFDFVYVDADHSEAAVRADLVRASLTVKPDGLIGGHDYTAQFPGVIAAVTAFTKMTPWQMIGLTRDGCPSYLLSRS